MTEYFFGISIAGALFPLRILLSFLATLHILLYKRDPGAAIGWIGAVWLMPFLGVLLYCTFGINRVNRLARKLVQQRSWSGHITSERFRCGVDGYFGSLVQAVDKLSGRMLLNGNKIRCLYNGDQTYPAMLEAIEKAKKTILLSTYILRNDNIGNSFADSLIRAHKQGVKVYVLVDGIGSGYLKCPIVTKLRKNGVKAGRFLQFALPWGMSFINMRTHRKVLVIDGEKGFIGGVNIGDENILAQNPRHPVSDTHFYLEGPVISQLAESFIADWFFVTKEALGQEVFSENQLSKGSSLSRVVTSGPDADMGKIEYTMLEALSLAQRSIRIMTPYFLPDERFLTVISMAALRGVEVDIVIPQYSNHPIVDWASLPNSAPLLQAGCRIWKVKPPFNHSKLMVIDGIWSFVGSSNLDVRSFRLNFETNLECYDSVLAKELFDFIGKHRHVRVTHYDLDRRGWLQKLRDSSARLLLPYL
ncbi:cardiolipin synthase [Entomobacter blattae]|uniref:Cardiolipin synthase n=1 Tax=Entomobacter blattae TaxID=2762277 RepID=A0A7H1NSI0_9PROT|nr:cardiolipin synthase [Entomobacter blattae]QNT78740.1 Major cardiolipin synthase ClsA [Entomobacter blattae]